MFKGDKQRKHWSCSTRGSLQDKNLAITDRMKCPIKLFKCLMETNISERNKFLRLTSGVTLQKPENLEGDKSLSQGLSPASPSLSPTAGQQPQISFERQFYLEKGVFYGKTTQQLSRQKEREGLKLTLHTQWQWGAPDLPENSPCSSALMLWEDPGCGCWDRQGRKPRQHQRARTQIPRYFKAIQISNTDNPRSAETWWVKPME